MAGFTYYVYFSNTGAFSGEQTQLTNVQSFRSFRGRQGSLDAISAGSFTITVMNPQQTVLVNQYVIITTSSTFTSPDLFVAYGQITDLQYQYYNQSITAGDVLTITCIDALGLIMAGNVTGNANSDLSGTFLNNTLAAAGLAPFYSVDAGLSNCSNQVYANVALSDAFNKIQNTERGHLWVRPYAPPLSYFRQRGKYTAQAVSFDPSTNSSTKQVYQEITFQSATTEVFSRFTIAPEGLLPQTYPSSPGSGSKTGSLDSYDDKTTQAIRNAESAAAMYSSTGPRIKSVTCFDKAQTTQKLNVFDVNDKVTVRWRNTDYVGIIEGIEVSASPNGAYYTFYFTSADTMNYLILDDDPFGKLDYNRLGF